ncbi:MAG: hypothetical protein N2712_06605 [Brevinematales bacterium]|nr:hypothetical protein [Brevinematales bacterium]
MENPNNIKLKHILKMYDNFGTRYFCEYEELKCAFRKKIKEYHPDLAGDENKAKEIISSYKELEKLYKDKNLFNEYKNLYISSQNKHPENNQSKYFKSQKEQVSSKFRITHILSRNSKFLILLIGIITVLIAGDILIGMLSFLVLLTILWSYRRI